MGRSLFDTGVNSSEFNVTFRKISLKSWFSYDNSRTISSIQTSFDVCLRIMKGRLLLSLGSIGQGQCWGNLQLLYPDDNAKIFSPIHSKYGYMFIFQEVWIHINSKGIRVSRSKDTFLLINGFQIISLSPIWTKFG